MVAAHVSVVSKDYSPYGYSIRKDGYALLQQDALGVGAYAEQEVVSFPLLAQDDDIVIERIAIMANSTITGDATRFWEISVGVYTPPAGFAPSLASVSSEGASPANDLTELVIRSFTPAAVDGVIPRGSTLLVSAEAPAAGAGPLQALDISVWVQYRRRA